MDVQQIKQQLEKSSLYQRWKKDKPQAYIIHFFWMNESEQIGYYEKEKDIITTFTLSPEVTVTEDKEIFKESDSIPFLALENVKVSLEQAKDFARKLHEEKYNADPIGKEIIILQTKESVPVYNITFITQTWKMLHIIINAETCAIVTEKIEPIMNFVQTVEGKKKNGV